MISSICMPVRGLGFPGLTRAALALACCLAVVPAVSRQLAPVDRLADAPPRVASAAVAGAGAGVDRSDGRTSDTRTDPRLGVPTFLWAERRAAGIDVAPAGTAAALSLRALEPAQAGARAPAQFRRRLRVARGADRSLPMAVCAEPAERWRDREVSQPDRRRRVFREEAALLLDADRALVAIGGFVTGGDIEDRFAFAGSDCDRHRAAGLELRSSNRIEAGGDSRRAATTPRSRCRPASSAPTVPALMSAARAKPVLFRLPGRLRPAYYVEVEVSDGAPAARADRYAYVIDAADLSVLFRHDQTADAAFTYRVFAEPSGNNLPLPNPSGRNGYPHPTAAPTPTRVRSSRRAWSRCRTCRSAATIRGWWAARCRPPATTSTPFADVSSPDGFSVGDFHASTTSPGTFDRTYDTTLHAGAGTTQKMAAVTNLFYVTTGCTTGSTTPVSTRFPATRSTTTTAAAAWPETPSSPKRRIGPAATTRTCRHRRTGGRPRMRMYVFDWRAVSPERGQLPRPPSREPRTAAAPSSGRGPST
jgi:hypothetical protein